MQRAHSLASTALDGPITQADVLWALPRPQLVKAGGWGGGWPAESAVFNT